MYYRINSMKIIEVEIIKKGKSKSKVKLLEEYPPHVLGEEIRVMNKRLSETETQI